MMPSPPHPAWLAWTLLIVLAALAGSGCQAPALLIALESGPDCDPGPLERLTLTIVRSDGQEAVVPYDVQGEELPGQSLGASLDPGDLQGTFEVRLTGEVAGKAVAGSEVKAAEPGKVVTLCLSRGPVLPDGGPPPDVRRDPDADGGPDAADGDGGGPSDRPLDADGPTDVPVDGDAPVDVPGDVPADPATDPAGDPPTDAPGPDGPDGGGLCTSTMCSVVLSNTIATSVNQGSSIAGFPQGGGWSLAWPGQNSATVQFASVDDPNLSSNGAGALASTGPLYNSTQIASTPHGQLVAYGQSASSMSRTAALLVNPSTGAQVGPGPALGMASNDTQPPTLGGAVYIPGDSRALTIRRLTVQNLASATIMDRFDVSSTGVTFMSPVPLASSFATAITWSSELQVGAAALIVGSNGSGGRLQFFGPDGSLMSTADFTDASDSPATDGDAGVAIGPIPGGFAVAWVNLTAGAKVIKVATYLVGSGRRGSVTASNATNILRSNPRLLSDGCRIFVAWTERPSTTYSIVARLLATDPLATIGGSSQLDIAQTTSPAPFGLAPSDQEPVRAVSFATSTGALRVARIVCE